MNPHCFQYIRGRANLARPNGYGAVGLVYFFLLAPGGFSQTLHRIHIEWLGHLFFSRARAFARSTTIFGLRRISFDCIQLFIFQFTQTFFLSLLRFALCLLFLQLDLIELLGVWSVYLSNDDDDDVVYSLCCGHCKCMRVNMSTLVVYFYAMTIQYEKQKQKTTLQTLWSLKPHRMRSLFFCCGFFSFFLSSFCNNIYFFLPPSLISISLALAMRS